MATYYKPSGRFSPLSFVLFILLLFTAVPLLAFGYAYAIYYIPFIYISFLLTAAFGFGVGFLTQLMAVRLGKVRNPTLAGVFGFLAGVIALYFQWAVWLDIFYAEAEVELGVLNLIFAPDALFALMAEINEVGAWGFGDTAVSGILLTIVWILEFLIITVISVFIALPSSLAPFCEETNKWFDEEKLPAFQVIGDNASIVKSLENGDESIFDEIELAGNSERESHSVFTLFGSEATQNYLSIENKHAKYNDKNELEFDDDMVIEYISMTDSLEAKLRERAKVS